MKNLNEYFQVKPYKDQNKYEQYAYRLHRISFFMCLLIGLIITSGLFILGNIILHWVIS